METNYVYVLFAIFAILFTKNPFKDRILRGSIINFLGFLFTVATLAAFIATDGKVVLINIVALFLFFVASALSLSLFVFYMDGGKTKKHNKFFYVYSACILSGVIATLFA